jgi:hypothetical protein
MVAILGMQNLTPSALCCLCLKIIPMTALLVFPVFCAMAGPEKPLFHMFSIAFFIASMSLTFYVEAVQATPPERAKLATGFSVSGIFLMRAAQGGASFRQ